MRKTVEDSGVGRERWRLGESRVMAGRESKAVQQAESMRNPGTGLGK